MPERSRAGEKLRRPTAVDDTQWRFQMRRAEELGVDFDVILDEVSSRSTAWRAKKQGATPQMLRKVDARLAEIEEARGKRTAKAELLDAWTNLGAELLMLDDEGVHFRQASEGAKAVLAAGRKLHEALSVFRKK